MSTPGQQFRDAIAAEAPLQIAGAINAYSALLAERAGFRALYLSGAGVANHSHGWPDTGKTELADVLIDARRITQRVPLPLLVDIDTGWDDPARTVREMAAAGVAAVHIEDQVPLKVCGHLPGKHLVSTEEMCARAQAYVAAGADMIFAEALHSLDDFRAFTAALQVPVLANLTEFGKTPYYTVDELRSAGIALALYPLGASRMAAAASLDFYITLRRDGTQQAAVAKMQTRADLYTTLGYTPPKETKPN
jgi:methylisocitrate lyase